MKYLISTNDVASLPKEDYGRVVLELNGNKDIYFKGFSSNVVDLGLPSGLLWATCNVGASAPTEAGLYFAWGDTQGYTADQVGNGEGQKKFASNFSDYVHSDGGTGWNNPQFTKYCNNAQYGKDKIFTDEYTSLEPEDDMATNNMSLKWRVPSKRDFYELLKNCIPTLLYEDGTEDTVNEESIFDTPEDNTYYFEWNDPGKYDYDSNHVVGMRLTSRVNGNTVFFPASGPAYDGSVYRVGSEGCFWSSSLREDDYHAAWFLGFYPDEARSGGSGRRYYGFPVRGVLGAGVE